jgi:molybdenum cofactor synthesis domain-containing protein
MRPFTSVISLDEARRRLHANIRPIGRTETVPLRDAAGRVAAEDVVSTIAVPPFPRSLMDGYAVAASDTTGATSDTPVTLRVIDRIHTGQLARQPVDPGACMEIATGAPLPQGADAVVMVEDTRPVGSEAVAILAAAVAGHHVGRRGADIAPGDGVVRRGDVLSPSRLGAIAAIGRAAVDVYARPRVAVLSTGNELIEPGQPLVDGQIYDVNRFTLAAVIGAHGGAPDARPPVPDTLEALTAALDGCRDADIVVFSGGSSVGERDLVVDLVAARGEMVFHGIAVRPGKPTAFARIGDTPFFGMPGNPTSCLSNAYILLVPFLRATARLPPSTARVVHARLGRRIVSPAGRHQFYTVRLSGDVALPAFKGSGDITSLSQADGYIEIPAQQNALEEGTIVEVKLF